MIFITHDIGLVAGIADKVMVMQNGRPGRAGRAQPRSSTGRSIPTRSICCTPCRISPPAARRARTGGATRTQAREPALKVDDLVCGFRSSSGFFSRATGAVHAVDGVDFRPDAGRDAGASSARAARGKSTTAKAVLGLVRSTRGIVLGRRNRRGLQPSKAPRRVQMVFQDPYASLDPRLTHRELLAEPADRHRRSRRSRDAGERWRRCWNASACRPNSLSAIRTNSPAASGKGSALPAR